MKRLIFTLITCLIFVTGYGSHLNSEIDIRSWNNSPFVLELNYQMIGQNSFHALNNIAPGRHRVKLMKRDGYSSCGPMRVLYNGFIDVPSSSKVTAVYRPNCGLTIEDVSPLFVAGNCGHGHPYGQCGHGCQMQSNTCNAGCPTGACACGNGGVDYYDNPPYGNGNTGNGGYGQGYGQGQGQGQGYGQGQGQGHGNHGNGYGNVNNTGNYGNVGFGLDQHQLNNLKYQVRNTPFDDDKLRIAMQAIKANGVKSVQVRELMEMMSFEANRLKLAKRAYQYTVDKQQYYMVNDAFAFSSSIRQLNNHIHGSGW